MNNCIPDGFVLSIKVYQFTDLLKPTLKTVAINNRTQQITDKLKEAIKDFPSVHTVKTDDELHVLRLLRHVREEVDGIKLKPENLYFEFDCPDTKQFKHIPVTEDGDFAFRIPGGFFLQRVSELF